MANDLLTVTDLTIQLNDTNKYEVVKDIAFSVQKGQAIGLVGESGCGKSVTAASILRLLPSPTFSIKQGQFIFDGQNLSAYSSNQFNKQFRWRKASMIFQDAAASFNPVLTIGKQMAETLNRVEQPLSIGRLLLQECGLTEVERILNSYPHQLSGGMKQRVAIAMALVGNPQLLIADEPTTAADATVQLQILQLLKYLQRKRNMSIIFISHDLNVISYICDYIYVMYCGSIIEGQPKNSLLQKPSHPYTKGLLASNLGIDVIPKSTLPSIPGVVPTMDKWHQGCAFYDRCWRAADNCQLQKPPLLKNEQLQYRCFYPLTDSSSSQHK